MALPSPVLLTRRSIQILLFSRLPGLCPTPSASDLACDCISSPRALPTSLFYVYWQESAGNSTYNSLQASLRVNDWHGLTSTLNYNWSHSIDDSSDSDDFVQNAAQPTDSTQ